MLATRPFVAANPYTLLTEFVAVPAYNAAHGGPIAVDGNWSVVLSASTTTQTVPIDLSASTQHQKLPPVRALIRTKI
jgi:hypothetical protein